jgi:hypothetical protein
MRKEVAVENIQVLLFSFFSPTRAKIFPSTRLKKFLENTSRRYFKTIL